MHVLVPHKRRWQRSCIKPTTPACWRQVEPPGVGAVLQGLLNALNTAAAAAGKDLEISTHTPPTGSPNPAASKKRSVSWNEAVKVIYVEPLHPHELLSPELMIEGLVLEISQLARDAGMLALCRQLATTKREMGFRIARFSNANSYNLEGHEKVWDTIVLNQRLLLLQSDLDVRVRASVLARELQTCPDAHRRFASLKARYGAARVCMEGGGDCGGAADSSGGAADGSGGERARQHSAP